jgi:hypothetical protein
LRKKLGGGSLLLPARKPVWRRKHHRQNQPEACVILGRQESKDCLFLPRSICEAETAALPALQLEVKELGGVVSLINPAVSIF